MPITFQPITLDSETDDRDAVLMLRDGRLVAVLTCLSDMHGVLAGRWFVEAAFRPMGKLVNETIDELASAESLLLR